MAEEDELFQDFNYYYYSPFREIIDGFRMNALMAKIKTPVSFTIVAIFTSISAVLVL